MRGGGPYFGAGDAPSARHRLGTRAHRGEIGPRIGLAHADAEDAVAGGDARQDRFALRLAAELEQGRPALPVGDPVRRDRRAGGERLLDHDFTFERRSLMPAIALWPSHAEPAARAERPAEIAVEAVPALGALQRGAPGKRLGKARAYLAAQLLGGSVARRGGEREHGPHTDVTNGQ